MELNWRKLANIIEQNLSGVRCILFDYPNMIFEWDGKTLDIHFSIVERVARMYGWE